MILPPPLDESHDTLPPGDEAPTDPEMASLEKMLSLPRDEPLDGDA